MRKGRSVTPAMGATNKAFGNSIAPMCMDLDPGRWRGGAAPERCARGDRTGCRKTRQKYIRAANPAPPAGRANPHTEELDDRDGRSRDSGTMPSHGYMVCGRARLALVADVRTPDAVHR